MTTAILGADGKPLKVNGKARPEAIAMMLANSPAIQRRMKGSYDAARDSTEFQAHWANTDALDADSSNSKTTRHKLMRRSRYEAGSNGFYDGILSTQCNMMIGEGPTLRMLTGSTDFNQLVEREFFRWTELIQLRRKLWCMAHARYQDGEAFAILQTNPALRNQVQLDLTLIEAEQCQTPYPPAMEVGYIDGIRYDEFGNVLWYDILPQHPGSSQWVVTQEPVRVSPREVLHWFKLIRPGAHRGVPALTSTLNVGATSRRYREATLAAAETAADLNVLMTTQLTPESTTDPMAPFSTLPIQKRMLTVAPMGWDAQHFKSEHPNAHYSEYMRSQNSELGRPMGFPVNLTMCDSSTYSFASGKLDMICKFADINVERQDCNDRVLNPMFAAWFREWTILFGRRDIPPNHQWDWPANPVIDVESEARANDIQLKNGTRSLRQHHSDAGRDYEDDLRVQAEDTFGEASEETIDKMRKINVLRNTPSQAMPFIAQLLGVESSEEQAEPELGIAAIEDQLKVIGSRIHALESNARR